MNAPGKEGAVSEYNGLLLESLVSEDLIQAKFIIVQPPVWESWWRKDPYSPRLNGTLESYLRYRSRQPDELPENGRLTGAV
jgi:hypothetical protein